MKKKRSIIGVGLLTVSGVLLFALVQFQTDQNNRGASNDTGSSTITIDNEPPASEPKVSGEQLTIEAEGTCLLHRDNEGPQTMECAMGVKTDDGVYYAIKDETSDYALVSKIQTGKRSRISGTLVREESPIYQSSGTLTVNSVEDL